MKKDLYDRLAGLADGTHGFPSTITNTLKEALAEIQSLSDDSFKLSCLENAGVDNWDGYSYAMEEYYAENPDD